MKKKAPSRLTLHRETLRTLDSGKLTWLLGGTGSGTCETCACTAVCTLACNGSAGCSYGTCAGVTADIVCSGAGCVAQ